MVVGLCEQRRINAATQAAKRQKAAAAEGANGPIDAFFGKPHTVTSVTRTPAESLHTVSDEIPAAQQDPPSTKPKRQKRAAAEGANAVSDEIPAAQQDPPSSQATSSQEFDDGSIRESLCKAAGGQPMDKSDEKLDGDPYTSAEADDEGREKNEAAAAAAAAASEDPVNTQFPDRQPNSWSGQDSGRALVTASGVQFDLKVNQWVSDTIDALQNDRSEELLTSQLGMPITEGNEDEVKKLFYHVAVQNQQHQADAALSHIEKQEQKRLKDGSINGFEARGYLGNVFRTFLNKSPEELEKYRNCATRVSQAAFRSEWARGQLLEFEKRRVYRQAWSRVDTTQGEYKNFAKLVVDLGGWKSKEAKAGAINCAQKCLCLGAPWIQVHPQTKLVEFLHLKFIFAEQFSQCWETFTSEWTSSNSKINDTVVPEAAKPEAPEENTEHGGSAKAKAKAKGKATDAMPETETKAASKAKAKKAPTKIEELDTVGLWRESKALKAKYDEATSGYKQVCDSIQDDEKWAWAEGTPQAEKMKESHHDLQSRLTDFHRQFLLKGQVDLKKQHTTAKCETELASFLHLGKYIDRLMTVTDRLVCAHMELQRNEDPA